MIIKKLTVENLGPFLGNWQVTLGEGVTAFVGEYEGAEDRSNRAGKSWLAVDVPLYVLHGFTRGGGVDDLPHRLARGKEDAWAELEVESSDGRAWLLRQGRTAGGEPIRMLDGSSVSERDLETVVRDEVLGLNAEEFKLTMAAVQGDVHSFMRLSAADKRRVVSPWFNTDRWIPRCALARRRMIRAQSKMRALDAEEERLRSLFDGAESLRRSVNEAEVTVSEWRAELERALRVEAEARARDARMNEAWGERTAVSIEVKRLEAQTVRERREAEEAAALAEAEVTEAEGAYRAAMDRSERSKTLEGRETALEDLRTSWTTVRNALTEAESTLREERRAREDLLEKYNALRDSRTGICPILRESCDRVQPDEAVLAGIKHEGLGHRRRIMTLEEEIKAIAWKLDHARSDVKMAEEEVRELRDLRGAQTPAQAMSDLTARKRAAEDAGRVLERVRLGQTETGRALRAVKKRLEGLPEVPEDTFVGVAEEGVRSAKSGLRVAEEAAAEARAAVAEVERAKATLLELEGRRASLRRELELTAWATYAFGAAGIPSREMENAFGSAESNMNRVLESLRTILRVRFSPTRELKEFEPVCVGCGTPFEKGERTHVCKLCGAARRRKRRDEMRLEVLDGEHASAWEMDSGGGKVLLSLGVRLGLAALPGERRRVRCEALLIDEPDGALDEPNRTALHNLLRGGLEDLGIRQVVLITHADIRREFERVVVVHRWQDEDRSGAWNG
jgi:DNA repair exonuclease SbcCD ATPase subunit